MMRRNRNNRRGKFNFRKGRMSNEADKNDGRCYECGKFGHIQTDCPELKKKLSRNIDNEYSGELGLMANINDEEDDSREPRSMSDEGTSETTCLSPVKSNQTGHHKKKTACSFCGKNGHSTNNCRNIIRAESSTGNSNSSSCSYCGKRGHTANHCRNTARRIEKENDISTTRVPDI
nr:cellular nucleic acid-binding protein-like [Nicotiana tomentosiformis]